MPIAGAGGGAGDLRRPNPLLRNQRLLRGWSQ
jgi:hypothetical protein